MSQIHLKRVSEEIFYFTDVFPEIKKIVEDLENDSPDEDVTSIIPAIWDEWIHGNPKRVEAEDGSTEIVDFEVRTDPEAFAGWQKLINWDLSLVKNEEWPRKEILESHSIAHEKAYKTIELIDGPYKECIKLWAKEAGVDFSLNWISKNYTIKKYREGGGVGGHADRTESEQDTMDWTALIYLTDDYEGGDVCFYPEGKGEVLLKPKAGSVVIFPCDMWHSANPVTSGSKSFIFMYIHSAYGISNSIKEHPYPLIEAIKRSKDGNN